MKETIVGALIIGGLIGGAILLTNPKTHNPIHQITAAKDMVWMSDDLHMNDQDGNKHVVIKKIRKSNDQKSDQHASKKTFIIKMGSDEQDVEVDVKATLEKLKEEMDSVDWGEVAVAVSDSFEDSGLVGRFVILSFIILSRSLGLGLRLASMIDFR